MKRHYRTFFLKLGKAPSEKVKKMYIKFIRIVRTVKEKARKYSSSQLKIINKFFTMLVQVRATKISQNGEWQVAPLSVLKPRTIN